MKHTWKKGLSLLLTFCLIAGLPPALRVSAADVTETEVTDWAALTASENNSVADVTTVDGTTTVALKTYVKTTDTLTVPAGKYVLDLHNYGIRFTGDAGSAITVGAGAELTLEDTNRFSWAPTNYITLNESGRGTSAGSAYSSGATSVNRGYITGGNGVGNRITAGGVHVSADGKFIMNGGAIIGNYATDAGGVFARGSVTISGSSAITGNTTVGNEYGALGRAGGVYVHCGNMLSVSGTPNITGNTAGRVGVDGVHADNAFLATTTAIDSAISGTQATITVTGTLDSAARIGVTVEGTGAENTTVPFTSGLSGKGEASNFTSDAEYAITLENNEAALDIGSYAAQIGGTKYTSLVTAMTALKTGDTLTLLGDVTTDGGLLFEGNKAVTLDLNGYGVRFTGDYGRVITVDSGVSLTLTDSAEPRATRYIALDENGRGVAVGDASGTGTVPVTGSYITGGSSRVDGGNIAVRGGGVRVCPDAVFTMNAGTILGNTANNGGGVYVVGTGAFTMNGGSISNNTAGVGEYGGNGGVYVSQTGAFTMTGGSIADNTAGFNELGGAGGGVYGNKNLTISGGSVIGNKAVAGTIWYSGAGGGIYVQSTGELRISGAVTIKDNSAALRGGGVIGSNNVFLSNSAESSPTTLLTPVRLVVTDALTGANIGVSVYKYKNSNYALITELPVVFTAANNYINTENFTSNFSSDQGNAVTVTNDRKQLQMVQGATVTFNSTGDSAIPSQIVAIGAFSVRPTDPTRTGYIFGGWYTDDRYTNEYDFASPVTADIILYAKWTAAAVDTGSDDYSGDSASPSSSPAANNSTAPASTDADGNTTLNVSATVASDGTATVGAVSDAAIAAIAASEEPQRNVVFDLSGLGDNVTTVSLSADTFAAVADALSEREGSGDSVTIATSTGEVQFSENAVGDETVSDFRGGAVTVGLPFTPRAGTLARDYRVYYAGTDGTLQRMPTGYSGGKLTFRTSHFSDYVIVYEKLESLFEDVKNATDYYYDAVLWACGNGITEGKTATLFAPADTCTRAQMVTFLWRASGSPTPKSTANPFGDVAESSYYYPAVLWAVENGITEGTGDGSTFSPDETVTRGQAVTFLYRLAGRKAAAERSFTDAADENAYFYDAVQWAIANGVTKGETETTFAPQAPCLRGQVMTFLYRTYVD